MCTCSISITNISDAGDGVDGCYGCGGGDVGDVGGGGGDVCLSWVGSARILVTIIIPAAAVSQEHSGKDKSLLVAATEKRTANNLQH